MVVSVLAMASVALMVESGTMFTMCAQHFVTVMAESETRARSVEEKLPEGQTVSKPVVSVFAMNSVALMVEARTMFTTGEPRVVMMGSTVQLAARPQAAMEVEQNTKQPTLPAATWPP